MAGESRKPRSDDVSKPAKPIDELSEKEKEDLLDHAEEFEGPDRREIRQDQRDTPKIPGVSQS